MKATELKEKSVEEPTATRKNSVWKYTLKYLQCSLTFDTAQSVSPVKP